MPNNIIVIQNGSHTGITATTPEFTVIVPSGPKGIQLGVPVYFQQTEPTIFPSLWFQTDIDGNVIDIRTVTG